MMKVILALLLGVLAVSAQSSQTGITSIANDTRQLTFGYKASNVGTNNVFSDGSGIVFRANPYGAVTGLYYVSTDSDSDLNVKRISQEFVALNGNVVRHVLSPNDAWVVYYGQQINYVDAPRVFFSVPSRGGTIEKVSGVVPYSTANNGNSIIFKPDSSRISWYANIQPSRSTNVNAQDIYTNTQDGKNLVRLNPDLMQNVTETRNKAANLATCFGGATANDEGVIFKANPGKKGLDDQLNLYYVNWDGSNLVQMSPSNSETTNPNTARYTSSLSASNVCGKWSADKQYIVYTSDELVQNQFDLFSFNRDTKVRKKINLKVDDGRDVFQTQYKITADSKNVVYAVQDAGSSNIGLYSTDIAGVQNVKLNTGLTSSSNFKVSSDSKWVIYTVDVGATKELYASKIGVEGNRIKISPNTVAGTVGVVSEFNFVTGTGNATNMVVYRMNTNVDGTLDLYVAALPAVDAPTGSNGASIARLTSGLTSPGVNGGFGGSTGYKVSSDNKYLVFRARITALNPAPGSIIQYSVFKVPVDGSAGQVLLAPKSFSNGLQTASTFLLSSLNSGYVVTRVTDGSVTNSDKVYSVTLGEEVEQLRDLTPVRSDGLLFASSSLASYEVHPNQNQIIYRASFPEPAETAPGFWSISINGGDLVKISFDGQDAKTQGPTASKTFLPDGNILYTGNIILTSITDYIRNRSPASYVAPALCLIAATLMMF